MAKNYHGLFVWGNSNISPSVTVTEGENDTIDMTVDGIDYSITIPAGEYITNHNLFTSELADTVNSLLKDDNIPVKSRPGGIHDDEPRTVLVFEHAAREEGHDITNMAGKAFGDMMGEVFSKEDAKPTPSDISDMESALQPRLTVREDLAGNGEIRSGAVHEDLEGSISAKGTENEDLNSTVGAQRSDQNDLDGTVGIPSYSRSDLTGSVEATTSS